MLHRTQLLLEPEQHEALCAIARREGRSISEIVRSLVQTEIDRQNAEIERVRERRLEAIRMIQEFAAAHPELTDRDYDAAVELDRIRDERNDELSHTLHDRH
jgi:hypothetical protein